MAKSDIESVLANWIRQALFPPGQLPPGADSAEWIACRFAEWWRGRAEEALGNAESAASAISDELTRLGGWETLRRGNGRAFSFASGPWRSTRHPGACGGATNGVLTRRSRNQDL